MKRLKALFGTKETRPRLSGAGLCLFFPFVHDSPATRFFLELTERLGGFEPTVVFTGVSRDEALRPQFEKYGTTHVMLNGFAPEEPRRQAKRMAALLDAMRRAEKVFALGVASKAFYRTVLRNKHDGMRCWDVLPWRHPLRDADFVPYLDGRIVSSDAIRADLGPGEAESPRVHVVSLGDLGTYLTGIIEKERAIV